MSELNKPDSQPENEGYIPASPVKRAMAWIGVVYMVILVALTTYPYFSGGVALTGIGPLLAVPGLVGLGFVVRISHRTTGSPSKNSAWLLAIISWVIAAIFLVPGITGLLANFA